MRKTRWWLVLYQSFEYEGICREIMRKRETGEASTRRREKKIKKYRRGETILMATFLLEGIMRR